MRLASRLFLAALPALAGRPSYDSLPEGRSGDSRPGWTHTWPQMFPEPPGGPSPGAQMGAGPALGPQETPDPTLPSKMVADRAREGRSRAGTVIIRQDDNGGTESCRSAHGTMAHCKSFQSTNIIPIFPLS